MTRTKDDLIIDVHSELWNDDDLDVTDRVVEVWEWLQKDLKWHHLPLKITTNDGTVTGGNGNWHMEDVPVNMKTVRDRVMHLVLEGGECWPGRIEPLALEGAYLVTMTDTEKVNNYIRLAMICWDVRKSLDELKDYINNKKLK